MNKIEDIVYVVKAEYDGTREYKDALFPILYKQIKEKIDEEKNTEFAHS